MKNTLDINLSEVERIRQQQLHVLYKEEQRTGGYEKWYKQLAQFQKTIYKQYIKFGIPGKIYRPQITVTNTGDVIDHHIISYLAPLTFQRIGWNGKRLFPYEQIAQLSEFFRKKGKRFIYAALPNKGNIYPSIICENIDCGGKIEGNAPQWRKFMRNVLEAGVEAIDFFPIFIRNKDEHSLFSKKHHISAYGAKIVGQSIAEYISATTKGIPKWITLNHEKCHLYCSDFGSPDVFKEVADVYYILDKNEKILYWNQFDKKSKIAIFGDCNLQSYCSHGAGISANLSYALNHPVYNAGRMLIYGLAERPITRQELDGLLKYDILIYVNFASAPFVRSATLSLKHPSLGYNWCNFKL